MSFRIYMRSLPLRFWGPRLLGYCGTILFLMAACRTPPAPDAVVRSARRSFAEHRDEKACQKLREASARSIAAWPRATAWEWLRLSALCAARSGAVTFRIPGLPAPFGPYAAAMFHFYRHETAVAQKILEPLSTPTAANREPAYRLGLILLLDERFEPALVYLQSALRDPVVPQAALRLAIARCLLGLGKTGEVAGMLLPLLNAGTPAQIASARRLMETALAWSRHDPPELAPKLEKVRTLLQVEEPAGALDELEKLLPQYPHSALLHYLRGVIHLRLGNRSDAVAELNEAIRIEPGDPEAHMLLGHVYFHAQRDAEARNHLEAAVAANPFLAAAWARLRDLHARNEAFARAVAAHETFMKLSERPDSVELLLTLAQLQEKAGRLTEAAAVHERIVRRQGDEEAFPSLVALARIHLALSADQLDHALEYRRRAAAFVRRAEKIRATDAELAKIKERLGMGSEKTKFEKKLRTRGGKPVSDDTNLLE